VRSTQRGDAGKEGDAVKTVTAKEQLITMRLAALEIAIGDARQLAGRNVQRFRPFNSSHEVFGVLSEEVREFFDEVCKREHQRSPSALRRELLDIAAVALRAASELPALDALGQPGTADETHGGGRLCWRCGTRFLGTLMCAKGTDGEICMERS
jgi:hypothetical protein